MMSRWVSACAAAAAARLQVFHFEVEEMGEDEALARSMGVPPHLVG